MNPWLQFALTLAALVVSALATSWTILHAHKKDEDGKRAAMWKRVDAIRVDLQVAQRDLAILQERLAAMPSRTLLDDRLQALEDKLERKLDTLGEQMQALLRTALEASR